MLELLLFSIEITLPIAIVVVLGAYFKRLGWIDDHFTQVGSKLVFKVALPALLFINVVNTDAQISGQLSIIGVAAVVIVAWFLVLSWLAYVVTEHRDERGVFVQGSFRGNMGIIGLAFSFSAFGAESAALASLYLAILTLVYNVLAVITLNRWAYRQSDQSVVRSSLIGLITNPLIIAILLAFVWRLSTLPVPSFVIESGKYLAQMTLPLALICIGASLSWDGIRNSGRVTLIATAFKLAIIPYSAAAIGHFLGYSGMELGIMYLMMATPTAAASYMMVRAMGGNSNMAANMIAITTVGSLFTTSFGLVMLKALNWI